MLVMLLNILLENMFIKMKTVRQDRTRQDSFPKGAVEKNNSTDVITGALLGHIYMKESNAILALLWAPFSVSQHPAHSGNAVS